MQRGLQHGFALALVALIAAAPVVASGEGAPVTGSGTTAGGSSGAAPGTGAQTGAPAPADIETMREVEQQLKVAGFDPGSIDGLMDQNTEQALRQYQQSRGFRVTGRLDDATRGSLLLGPGTSSGAGSGAAAGSTGTSPGAQAPSGGATTGSGRPGY